MIFANNVTGKHTAGIYNHCWMQNDTLLHSYYIFLVGFFKYNNKLIGLVKCLYARNIELITIILQVMIEYTISKGNQSKFSVTKYFLRNYVNARICYEQKSYCNLFKVHMNLFH